MTNEEKKYLRDLAQEFKAASETTRNNQTRQAWYDLNDLKKGAKPLFINHYWPVALGEIFPEENFCKTPRAVQLEKYFKTRLFYVNDLQDDNVIEPVVYFNTCHTLESYQGMARQTKRAESDHGSGAFEMIPTIVEEEDINKITNPKVTYNKERSFEDFQLMQELFDGILTPIRNPVNFAAKISDEYSWYRGMESTYLDIYDNPEWMHDLLSRISNNFEQRFNLLEEIGVYGCMDLSDPLGSAGLRYITGMPDFRDIKGSPFDYHSSTKETWGFSCSEVFNCVSNANHDEFTFQYDIKAMDRFKYCNVGCCEVLDKKVDLIRGFSNCRKVSVSEWCDYETAAAAIREDFVYSYRAAGIHFMPKTWDKANAEKEIRGVLEASKRHNCNTEIVLNIGGTFNGEPRKKAIEWSKMTRELINEYYN